VGSVDAALESANPELVVPCDDLAAAHLHAIYARATRAASPAAGRKTEILLRSMGSPASFSLVASRQETMDLASSEGLLVPSSAWIPDLLALDAWLAENGLPAVLKADCTSGGEGVRIVKTRQQARRAYRELVSRGPSTRTLKRMLIDADIACLARTLRRDRPLVSVQQFIPGRDSNVAVACWKGEVLAQIAALVLQARAPKGPAAVIKLIENPQMDAAVKKVVRRLNLSGFVGFDFLIEDRTGNAFLVEINPRATQTCHLALGAGRHPVAALCTALTGAPPARKHSVTARQTIVLWPHLPESSLPAEIAGQAYFDTPRRDPEILRRYGSRTRFAWTNALKTLWRAARA